jgi:hypothetical protein
MKKFLLMFICLNLFATVDTLLVTQITTDNTISHRFWSDTVTWNRTANDSLLILTEDALSFEILNWDYVGVHGTYGWENTVLYYQLGNTEVDFDSMVTWDSVKTVGASSDGPDIQERLSSLPPSELIRFLAIASGSTNALLNFQLLFIEDYR